MHLPEGYDGPKLEIVLRTLKPVDNTDEVIQKVFSQIKNGGKIALYQKDQPDGDLTEKVLNHIAGHPKAEMKEFMDKVNMVKITPEIDNMKLAAKFIKWTFENIVNEIEDIIEVDKGIKHS